MRPRKGIRARCTVGREKKIEKSLGGSGARCNRPETGGSTYRPGESISFKIGTLYRELGWTRGPSQVSAAWTGPAQSDPDHGILNCSGSPSRPLIRVFHSTNIFAHLLSGMRLCTRASKHKSSDPNCLVSNAGSVPT